MTSVTGPTGTVGPTGPAGPLGNYGSFFNITTQSNFSIAKSIVFSNTSGAQGFNLANNSRVNITF